MHKRTDIFRTTLCQLHLVHQLFLQSFLPVWNFVQSLNLTTEATSVSRCESPLKIEKICYVYSTKNYLNTATTSEINVTAYWFIFYLKFYGERSTGLCAITAKSYKQSLQNTLNESTYSEFSFHLKVNRDNYALINRPWKWKKAKDWRLPLTFRKGP